MPIYEYACRACGQKSETMQKISEPAPATCPHCGKEGTLERIVSRTSFHLKGGGWHQDLYSSSKKEASSEPSGSAPAEKKPEAKEKPAEKPAEKAAEKSSSGGGESKE